MATPGQGSRLPRPGRTPASQRKLSDSHAVREQSQPEPVDPALLLSGRAQVHELTSLHPLARQLRALSQADSPRNSYQLSASTYRHSLHHETLAPIGLPATPGNPDLARRRSLRERTPRQVLAAQRLVPKSARKSVGGDRGGREESPGDLLRQLSRSKLDSAVRRGCTPSPPAPGCQAVEVSAVAA